MAVSKTKQRVWEFGPFRLDEAERLLLRDGEPVGLKPKVFDMLVALLEHSGHLVEKETLMESLWPDTFVEESALTRTVSDLRKALGEEKYVETVPKHGYRFVAKVREQNGAGAKRVIGELVTPGGAIEMPPRASDVKSLARRSKRSPIILSFFAFLAPILVGIGLWLYFNLEKKTEVAQLEFKGGFFATRWTEEDARKGIEYYNRAITLDPNSTSAYIGLAVTWNFLSDLYVSPREAMPNAKAAAVNILQIDKTSAPAHVVMGYVKMRYEWDWAGAENEFRRAIALAPEDNSAHRAYGWYLIALGRFDEAQAEMKRTLESDPLDDNNLRGLGLSFYFARQYEQAIEQSRRAIGVDRKSQWSHLALGWAYEQQGRLTEAIAELREARQLDNNPQLLASLGHAYALSGQRAEAQKVFAELTEITRHKYVSPYDVATVSAGLGEKEQAFVWLEKAYEDRSGGLAVLLKVDPKLDGLRSDSRFRDLLRRVGLSE